MKHCAPYSKHSSLCEVILKIGGNVKGNSLVTKWGRGGGSYTHVRLWLDIDMLGLSLCLLDEMMLHIVVADNVALCTALTGN